MPDFKIIKLPPARWKEYRKLRLSALQDTPEAFGMSYEQSVEFPDEKWIEPLEMSDNEERLVFLFAEKDKNLIGIAGLIFGKKGCSHTAKIVSVYVKPEFRKLGIAEKLFKTAIKKCEERGDCLKISLLVNSQNQPAISLYRKMGFREVGILEKELRVGDKLYDEMMMEMVL